MGGEGSALPEPDHTTWFPATRGLGSWKKERPDGQESNGHVEAPSRRWRCEAVAPRRPGSGSARHQHHGILQGVQRQDSGHGKGCSVPDRDHLLSGQVVHLRDQDAAGVLLSQESRQAGVGLQDAGQGNGGFRDRRPSS